MGDGKKSDEEKLYEAYKIAIQGRNFHYEQFNKWMSFFYVAIGAIFYAYFNTKIEGNVRTFLAMFGLIVSFLGYLSCKGYYLYINNWISQIIRFENLIEEKYRVYSPFSLGVYGLERACNDHPSNVKEDDITYFKKLTKDEKKELRKRSLNNMLHPLKPSNVSTSKISLVFFTSVQL
jgi:hypothetical protein